MRLFFFSGFSRVSKVFSIGILLIFLGGGGSKLSKTKLFGFERVSENFFI